MGTVDVFTAARSQAIEDTAIIDGYINGSGHLILVQHNGTEIDAGDALLAVPPASTTQSGYVELATTAEADAHTDTTRAVTPASLVNYDARLDTLEAFPALSRVTQISAPAETALPSAYPVGVSVTYVGTGSGWAVNGGFGSIITVNQTNDRCVQTFYAANGGTVLANSWFRTHHTSTGGGGWTAWQRVTTQGNSDSQGMTGEIRIWAAASAPSGWALCEGQAISRTTFAALFALLGTNYGAGDGSSTFNVPDMRGRVPVGFDSTQTEFDTRGKTGGEKTHLLTSAEMPSHTHTQNSHAHSIQGNGALTDGSPGTLYQIQNGTFYGFRTAGTNAATATNQNTGGGGAHNNIQPYNTVKYIIKT